MTITFYTLSKRKNSTKQPAITGSDYTGTLTTASGIVNPSIIMDFGNTAPTYNYAYISEFGRYYWINEITSIGGGLWQVDMSCDVLASFKSSIGNNSKYVLRSASSNDGLIVDMKYPTKAGYTYNVDTAVSGLSPASNPLYPYELGGNYIVGVVSPSSGANVGSLNFWNLDDAQFRTLRNLLSPASYYSNITDVDLQNVAIDIVNPMQYIAFVRWYPMQIVPGNLDTMELGPLTMTANTLSKPVISNTTGVVLDFSDHPLAATRGKYLSCEPYTQRFLSWLPIGMIHVPATTSLLSGIRICYKLDLISGTGDLIITPQWADAALNPDTTTVLYRTSFNVGADIPIAQITTGNPLKLISGGIGLVGTALSAATGNVVGALTSGVGAISDFIGSMVPEVQAMKPGSGSLMDDANFRLIECFANVVDDDNAEFGRPLCKAVSISTLSGFVQCADPEVYAVGATAPELEEIGSYMTGGFFYE